MFLLLLLAGHLGQAGGQLAAAQRLGRRLVLVHVVQVVVVLQPQGAQRLSVGTVAVAAASVERAAAAAERQGAADALALVSAGAAAASAVALVGLVGAAVWVARRAPTVVLLLATSCQVDTVPTGALAATSASASAGAARGAEAAAAALAAFRGVSLLGWAGERGGGGGGHLLALRLVALVARVARMTRMTRVTGVTRVGLLLLVAGVQALLVQAVVVAQVVLVLVAERRVGGARGEGVRGLVLGLVFPLAQAGGPQLVCWLQVLLVRVGAVARVRVRVRVRVGVRVRVRVGVRVGVVVVVLVALVRRVCGPRARLLLGRGGVSAGLAATARPLAALEVLLAERLLLLPAGQLFLLATLPLAHRLMARRQLSPWLLLLLNALGHLNQVLQPLDGHLDDLGLFHTPPALLHVMGRDQLAQVRQTVVHAVPSTLLDDPVRRGVLLLRSPTGTSARAAASTSTSTSAAASAAARRAGRQSRLSGVALLGGGAQRAQRRPLCLAPSLGRKWRRLLLVHGLWRGLVAGCGRPFGRAAWAHRLAGLHAGRAELWPLGITFSTVPLSLIVSVSGASVLARTFLGGTFHFLFSSFLFSLSCGSLAALVARSLSVEACCLYLEAQSSLAIVSVQPVANRSAGCNVVCWALSASLGASEMNERQMSAIQSAVKERQSTLHCC